MIYWEKEAERRKDSSSTSYSDTEWIGINCNIFDKYIYLYVTHKKGLGPGWGGEELMEWDFYISTLFYRKKGERGKKKKKRRRRERESISLGTRVGAWYFRSHPVASASTSGGCRHRCRSFWLEHKRKSRRRRRLMDALRL